MLPLAGRPNFAITSGRFSPIQCPFNVLQAESLNCEHCSKFKAVTKNKLIKRSLKTIILNEKHKT